MAHNLELRHHSSVIQSGGLEIIHEFISDVAELRQRLERTIKELLILLSCLVAYVVEQFDGVASRVDKHTQVYNVNNGCTFSLLHPS